MPCGKECGQLKSVPISYGINSVKSPYTTFEDWSRDLVFVPVNNTLVRAYLRHHYAQNGEYWNLTGLTSDRILGFRDLPGDGSEPLVSQLSRVSLEEIDLLTEPGWMLVDRGRIWFATPELKTEFDTLVFLRTLVDTAR